MLPFSIDFRNKTNSWLLGPRNGAFSILTALDGAEIY